MALARKPNRRDSLEEYLALEEDAEARSEFLDGAIDAMTGGVILASQTVATRGGGAAVFGKESP